MDAPRGGAPGNIAEAGFQPSLAPSRDSLVVVLVKNQPAMQETLVRFLGHEDWAFLVTQMAKSPPALRKTWVRSLG